MVLSQFVWDEKTNGETCGARRFTVCYGIVIQLMAHRICLLVVVGGQKAISRYDDRPARHKNILSHNGVLLLLVVWNRIKNEPESVANA